MSPALVGSGLRPGRAVPVLDQRRVERVVHWAPSPVPRQGLDRAVHVSPAHRPGDQRACAALRAISDRCAAVGFAARAFRSVGRLRERSGIALSYPVRVEPIDVLCRPSRVKRHLFAGVACATMTATLIGCTASSQPSSAPPRQSLTVSTDPTIGTQTRGTPTRRPDASDHGSLTEREFAVAVAIARHELNKNPPWSVSSVTATVSHGTVVHGNVGPHRQCLSGTLLHIKFIGTFPNIVHGGVPGLKYLPVSAVLEVADPASGDPCLVGVGTGHEAPSPGATALFAR